MRVNPLKNNIFCLLEIPSQKADVHLYLEGLIFTFYFTVKSQSLKLTMARPG